MSKHIVFCSYNTSLEEKPESEMHFNEKTVTLEEACRVIMYLQSRIETLHEELTTLNGKLEDLKKPKPPTDKYGKRKSKYNCGKG